MNTRIGRSIPSVRGETAGTASERVRPRAERWRSVAAIAVALATLLVDVVPATAQHKQLPKFKVTGQYQRSVAVLVPKETTDDQLRSLILGLRNARLEDTLSKLLPATTPGGSQGPHGVVVVYVFSDPAWATSEAMKRCAEVPGKSQAYVDCGGAVRAYYFYRALPPHEEGSLGYAEGARVFSKTYERLF